MVGNDHQRAQGRGNQEENKNEVGTEQNSSMITNMALLDAGSSDLGEPHHKNTYHSASPFELATPELLLWS